MENQDSISYNGYLILAAAEQLVDTDTWMGKLSIARPSFDEPKNVQEHFFAGWLKTSFPTREQAVEDAKHLGRKLIDKQVPGLDF